LGVKAASKDNNNEDRSANQDKLHDPCFADSVPERVRWLISVNTLVHVLLLEIKSKESTQTKPNVDNELAELGHGAKHTTVEVSSLANKPQEDCPEVARSISSVIESSPVDILL